MADAEITIPDVEVTAQRPPPPNPGPPSGTSWTQKQIDVTLTLGLGSFGQTGKNTVKLSGLRVVATIQKLGSPAMDKASVRVYGVTPTVMNEVSTLGIPLAMWRQGNAMLVQAGDSMTGMSTVYSGYLRQAYQDFDEAPDTFLSLVGWGGQETAIFPTAPISFPGQADVATMMSGIAQQQGWAFSNSGVQVQLSNPYFAGTARVQVMDIARAANIEARLDASTSPLTLAIWPKYGTQNGLIPLVSPTSGLLGYPKFQSNGMSFKTLFNPNIRLGGQIKMQSAIAPAATDAPASAGLPPGTQTGGPNGLWTVISPLTYELSAQLPGGPWGCDVHCARSYQAGGA